MDQVGIGARLGIAFDLECKDAAGNVLKVIHCKGSFPLSDAGLSVEQAQELINQQEPNNGTDRSE
jgi:hypothetical protein